MKKFLSIYKPLLRWLILSVFLFGSIFTAQTVKADASPCSATLTHQGIITADETWCAGVDPHVLLDNVTVQSGVTLTIAPGVTVVSGYDIFWKYLTIQGHLDVLGTATQPVVMRRYPTPVIPGEWGGIYFDGSAGDGSGDINYATIEEAGANFSPPGYCWNCGPSQFALLVKDLPAGKQVNINNSILRDNPRKGLYVINSTVNVTNTTFSHNMYPILIEGAASVVTYSGNTFSDNAYPYYDNTSYTIQEDSIFISQDALTGQNFTLPAQTGLEAYVWWDNTTIPAGVTMNVEPGVTLRKAADNYLIVQGHLDAIGTPALPVLFTGIPNSSSNPNVIGNWGGIYFEGSAGDGSADINNATIEKAGSNFSPPGYCWNCGPSQFALLVKDLTAGKQVNINNSILRDNLIKGLYVNNGRVNVTNTTFSQNKYPILIDGASSVVTYSGNTFSNNAYPYYDNTNYTVQEDSIFINPGALMGHDFSLPVQTGLDAYVMWGHTTIPAGVTMTVEPGVTVRMDGDKYLTIQGHLDAIGTQALPIHFTGIPSSTPTVFLNWGGLYFDGVAGDGSGNLNHVTIERSGSNFLPPSCVGTCGTAQTALFVKDLPVGKQLNISNSIIKDSLNKGLYVVNSPTAHVDGNLIKGGRIGAYFDSNMTISNLALTDQTLDGIVVGTGYSVDARHLTIAQAGQSGFHVLAGGTGILKNSILSHNALAVWAEGSGQATLNTNLADANTTFKSGTVTGLNTINGSAAFAADGYHIQTMSDAVGKGLPGLSVVDMDGQARPLPVGSLPDLGADEVPVGSNTFSDVSNNHWARLFIERLYGAGITRGCGVSPLIYCPDATVTRAEMAVFLLRSMHGSGFTPPLVGTSTGFSDVPITHWAAAWIKQLAAEGITSGCGTGLYCPTATVTRAEMAVFLLRGKHSSGYTPPLVGTSTGFSDVPITHWAAAWIKQLAFEGITSGCGPSLYCPTGSVTRAEMAVFLVRAFSLP